MTLYKTYEETEKTKTEVNKMKITGSQIDERQRELRRMDKAVRNMIDEDDLLDWLIYYPDGADLEKRQEIAKDTKEFDSIRKIFIDIMIDRFRK